MLKQNRNKAIDYGTENSTNNKKNDFSFSMEDFKFAVLGGILGGFLSFLLRQI